MKEPQEGMSIRIREDEPVVTSRLRGVTRRRADARADERAWVDARLDAWWRARATGETRGRRPVATPVADDWDIPWRGTKTGVSRPRADEAREFDGERGVLRVTVSAGRALRWLPKKLRTQTGILGRSAEASEVAVEVRRTVGRKATGYARLVSSRRAAAPTLFVERNCGNKPHGRGERALRVARSKTEERVKVVETAKAQTAGAREAGARIAQAMHGRCLRSKTSKGNETP